MVNFNYSSREVTVKIVYYGPGLCGKTTSLQHIYSTIPQQKKGKMVSLATQTDRTLFFDFLPIELGKIKGLNTKIQLYTVPGQVFYDATRKLVLKGVDGIVFVADSQKDMLQANIESFKNLVTNLKGMGLELEDVPYVFQYNKTDLPKITSIDELNKSLNIQNVPYFKSSALTGEGVHETLVAVIKMVLTSISQKYNLKIEEMVVEKNKEEGAKKTPEKKDDKPEKPSDKSGKKEVVSEISGDDFNDVEDSVPLSEVPFPSEFSTDLEELNDNELTEIGIDEPAELIDEDSEIEELQDEYSDEHSMLDLPEVEVVPGMPQHIDGNHYHVPLTIVLNSDADLSTLKLTVDLNFRKSVKRKI